MRGIGAMRGMNFAEMNVQPRLVKAAHEFEAQMMKELLKPMTGSDPLTGEDRESGSGAALQEFASESLGQAVSEQGGLGIANGILRSLSRSRNSSQNSTEGVRKDKNLRISNRE
jgi:Rod binding domain-containing protein